MDSTLDFQNLFLGASLKNLECSECSNVLSFFPIFLSVDMRNICGRCYDTINEKNKYVHNEAYEMIAQFIYFPCRYKNEGCPERLLPLDMVDHEKICSYQTMNCPTTEFTDCKWKGPVSNILLHCQDKHSDIALKNGEFNMNLAQSLDNNNLLEHDSELFIVTRKYYAINKLLEIAICNLGTMEPKKYACEIHFKNTNRNLIVSCNTTSFSDKKVTEIFLDSLKDRENESSIAHCKINLENKKDEGIKTKTEVVNVDLLSTLICSSCSNYALPPIYQIIPAPKNTSYMFSNTAVQNNSLFLFSQNDQNEIIKCYTCKAKTVCFGSSPSNDKRNFTLEKLALKLNYPCKFEKNGCGFVGKPPIMKTHLEFCPYGQYPCTVGEYIGCGWIGLGKCAKSHLEEDHQPIFISSSSEVSVQISDKSASLFNNSSNLKNFEYTKCYIIRFCGELFHVVFSEKQELFYWTVQEIGQVAETFMYELEIIDPNDNKRLAVRQRCSSWKKKDQLFTTGGSYCCFNSSQIQPFVNPPSTLTFKITVCN